MDENMIRPSELMTGSPAPTAGDATAIDALMKGLSFLLRFMGPDELLGALMYLAKTQGVPVDKAKLQEMVKNAGGPHSGVASASAY